MTAKPKADIYKIIYLFLILLVALQLVDFLVFKFFLYSFNSQLVLGLVGNNIIAYTIALPIFVLFVYLTWKKIVSIEASLILAGLCSNVTERLIYGGVIDYFTLFSIPKFNLADIMIIIGSTILAYRLTRSI